MSDWVECPSCQLKHSPRPDGHCPRCRQPLAAGAAGPAAPAWVGPPVPAAAIPASAPARHGYCTRCGAVLSGAGFCPGCGQAVAPPEVAGRSKVAAGFIAFFLGGVGCHKFYLGKPGWGVLYLLFFWTGIPRVVSFVEAILLWVMDDAAFREKYPGRPSGGAMAAVVLVPLVFIPLVLAAIAIPNFLRYQLRSQHQEVVADLRELMRAEVQRANAGRGLRDVGPFPAAPPAHDPHRLTEAERALAADLGWKLGPATRGQFRMATAADAAGNRAASFCAESDLDEDGVNAAVVGFLPVLDEAGAVILEPPPPPCSPKARIGADGATYRPAWQGKLMTVSPPDVF